MRGLIFSNKALQDFLNIAVSFAIKKSVSNLTEGQSYDFANY